MSANTNLYPSGGGSLDVCSDNDAWVCNPALEVLHLKLHPSAKLNPQAVKPNKNETLYSLINYTYILTLLEVKII